MGEIEFSDIRRFMAIVEHGSFRRAAESLNITSPALSQSLKALESKVGVRLVDRTTRVVGLTSAGVQLAWRLRPAMDEIRLALAETGRVASGPSGTLRVHVMRHASRLYLEPYLPDFAETYPEIKVEVTLGDTPADIIAEGYDVSIRLGEMLPEDGEAIPLGPKIRDIAAAAPSYLKRHGSPDSPAELYYHRCITWREQGVLSDSQWIFVKDGQLVKFPPQGVISFNDPKLALEAAARGAGVVYWNEKEIKPYVDRGQLVPLFSDWGISYPGYYLCLPKSRLQFSAPRAFLDFMKSRSIGEK